MWRLQIKTRSIGQSPTWSRPAPQVRLERQFRWLKFRSEQRHLANIPENCTLEPRGEWNCVQLQWMHAVRLGRVNMRTYNFLFVNQSSPSFFSPNAWGVVAGRLLFRFSAFPFFDTSIPSGDTHDQSRRLHKIDRNFACFWPLVFLVSAPPRFWAYIIKFCQFPIMWQSFTEIGRGTSGNAWWDKKNITGKT